MRRFFVSVTVVGLLIGATFVGESAAQCTMCGGPPSPQGDRYCMEAPGSPFICIYAGGVCHSIAYVACGDIIESVPGGLTGAAQDEHNSSSAPNAAVERTEEGSMRRSLMTALVATVLAVPSAQITTARAEPAAAVVGDPNFINLPELGSWMIEHNVRHVADVPKNVLAQWRVPSRQWGKDHKNQNINTTWSEQDRVYLMIANGFEPTDEQLAKMGFDPATFWGVRNPVNKSADFNKKPRTR